MSIEATENVDRLIKYVISELKNEEELRQFCAAFMVVSGAICMTDIDRMKEKKW